MLIHTSFGLYSVASVTSVANLSIYRLQSIYHIGYIPSYTLNNISQAVTTSNDFKFTVYALKVISHWLHS